MTHRGYFLGELKLHELVGERWNGEYFVLLEDLTYVDVDPRTGAEVFRWTATGGESVTNFASIPILRRNGRHNRGDVIHDDECRWKRRDSRAVHDMYKRMLEACGCSWFIVWTFWRSVRLFGPRFN